MVILSIDPEVLAIQAFLPFPGNSLLFPCHPLPSPCHSLAIPLPFPCHPLQLSCHPLPLPCHPLATPYHPLAIPLPPPCHSFALSLPSPCRSLTIPLPFPLHPLASYPRLNTSNITVKHTHQCYFQTVAFSVSTYYPFPATPPSVPMPVPIPVPAPVPAPLPVPVPIPVPGPLPVPVPIPVPVPVPPPMPLPVPIPVPVPQPVPVPIPVPQPPPVPIPVPVPVPVPPPTLSPVGPCVEQPVLSCGFGSTDTGNGACTFYYEASMQDYSWQITSGAIPGSFSGPNRDHTGDVPGYYVYSPGSNAMGSQAIARMSTGSLSSVATPTSYKLSFWYYMYGSSLGALNVYSINNQGVMSDIKWSVGGPQLSLMDAQWRYASFYLSPQTDRVMFETIATSTMSTSGDVIAIDDIRLVTSCVNEGTWYLFG